MVLSTLIIDSTPPKFNENISNNNTVLIFHFAANYTKVFLNVLHSISSNP